VFRYDQFGAHDDNGAGMFSVFLPGPTHYSRGGDPKITQVKVFGTFQVALGDPAWSAPHALTLHPQPFEGGTLHAARTAPLEEAFYEYKYLVEFENGERRIVSDPCARYSGGDFENSGIVIGGSRPADNTVAPLRERFEPGDLVIYELMIEDFTHHLSPARAPVDMVVDKLDYIVDMGFNAIEFMPWTAWVANRFSWGYMPFLYFAPEHRYVDDPTAPAEKLSRLKHLVGQCHERGLHVIMDGVFNHVDRGAGSQGFPYYWLYQDPMDSPFIGRYGDAGYGDEIDFSNSCAQQFIADVCRYWIDTFAVDGLRLDHTKGLYIGANATGLPKLIGDIREHLETKDAAHRTRFPIFIEHLEGYGAIDVANKADATGCWYDEMLWRTRDYLGGHYLDDRIMRLLDTGRDFEPGRVPTTYVENHDHSEIASVAGGRSQWYRAQPYLISLLTCFGAPLLYNGQEFAEDYWMPEGHLGDRHGQTSRATTQTLGSQRR
jgi:1,4-alpha-glucan branching enzyme